jgi:hypothetical protein
LKSNTGSVRIPRNMRKGGVHWGKSTSPASGGGDARSPGASSVRAAAVSPIGSGGADSTAGANGNGVHNDGKAFGHDDGDVALEPSTSVPEHHHHDPHHHHHQHHHQHGLEHPHPDYTAGRGSVDLDAHVFSLTAAHAPAHAPLGWRAVEESMSAVNADEGAAGAHAHGSKGVHPRVKKTLVKTTLL